MYMLLGKISGRITTKGFSFEAEARVNRLDYISMKDPEGRWILGRIDSVVRYAEKTMAKADIIGYRDSRGFLKTPTTPFAPGTPIFAAEKDFISKTLGLPEEGAYIGLLEGYKININLPLKHLLTKHIAILAKTGGGKSYAAGVLLEELAEKGVPVVVIDPHGEYYSLAQKNTRESESRFMESFGIEPKSYKGQIRLFDIKGLKLDSRLGAQEIFQMLPAKVSSSQKGILYSALKNLQGRDYTLRDIIDEVAASPQHSKWGLISILEVLDDTRLFSANPTNPREMVKEGRISIIDLNEAKPEIQQIIVMKLSQELFQARKRGEIPEFLLMLEEAHNFCPERGFGEVASSRIVRDIASEGRKFGLGLCVISQRPARVDKNVLSQCNTQIILKVTNPNDLNAIVDSVEGVTPGLREEIKDLPIGGAVVVGVSDHPLILDIRVRRSLHGGELIKPDIKKELSERRNLLFEPRCSLEEVKKVFKGIREASLLNYPLWRARANYTGRPLEIYIDGISGEMLTEDGGEIRRTSGIRGLLDLNPSSRAMLLYLSGHRFATVGKLAEELNMPLSAVQANIKGLLNKDLVASDGYMFRSKADASIPRDPLRVQLSEKPREGEVSGQVLEFMVPVDFVRKVTGIWNLSVLSIDPVYYPYWLIKHSGGLVLVDGLTRRADTEAAGIVKKML